MIERITSRVWGIVRGNTRSGQISKESLAQHLPGDPVIVEAGAHIGVDTVEMARRWNNGFVHAFEPLPHLYTELQKRTRKLNNVATYPLALGDYDGKARFFVSSGASDASSSLLEPKEHLVDHGDVAFKQQIEVIVTTLDNWAARCDVSRIDLLWLDMQGFELSALKAARRLLPTVRAIHIEVFLKESYSNVPLYPEVRDWLAAQGFRVEREELPWPDSGNVLFVRDHRQE
ncbi:MAG TPA: FkbM family methyltransferase [Chloroflexaceae bacterium]|nr:FkbM family methyltransferase [Chloroflexaceae bacterium]